MSKWIAEFDLEDGDTMPEHMDLEYKGAKIDFHCKPLEQDPKPMVEIDLDYVIKQKYIEREVLDKIRAEIEKLQKMCDKNDLNLMAQYSAFGMVLDILDKYKAETEAEDGNGERQKED